MESLYKVESAGSGFNYAIEILANVHPEINLWDDCEEIRQLTHEYVSSLQDAIQAAVFARSPERQQSAKTERTEILSLFDGESIFVEEVPNGYCPKGCCRHLPWFVVTTTIGRIKIGWRKRVIQIDWSDSTVHASAEDLFSDENVTKVGRMIHAWGYKKAGEYIQALLEYSYED